MIKEAEPISVTLQVSRILEKLHIPYMITGSIASAVHGLARTTMDVDLVADFQIEQCALLIQNLSHDFFVDEEMIQNSLKSGRSFNIIHKETMFKVDFFLKKDQPYDQVQFNRRIRVSLSKDPESKVFITSPEDLILAKLDWYRQGGCLSNRQWEDIINVIKVQEGGLDQEYLKNWADRMKLVDLLSSALLEGSTD